ncbi:MAG: hypothetical protein KGI28_01310 [Thaumarchaeota archaeon]|nr:hypothetical protein [Nitrososphaerota archaeon]
MSEDNTKPSRVDLLDVMDGFISKILSIRKILLGVTISGFILAPFSIGLCIFLFTHPHFFRVLQGEYKFGLALGVLLGIIIAVSIAWMVIGIRQHRMLKLWNKKFQEYQQQKDEIDKKIASDYGIDED